MGSIKQDSVKAHVSLGKAEEAATKHQASAKSTSRGADDNAASANF